MRKLCRCHEDEKCRRETLTEWMRVVSTEGQEWIRNEMLALGHATLERQKDKIGAAANAKLAEQIGDMEFYGALRQAIVHAPPQVDAAAWAVVFVARLDVGRARAQAQAAMDAVHEQFVVDV